MDCKRVDLKNNEHVKQLFILSLIHGLASGFGGGRRYYDTYMSKQVYHRIQDNIGNSINPVLACLEIFKFRSTKFCFGEKFGNSYVSEKYNTKEFLKIIAKNYTSDFDFANFKRILKLILTDIEIKEILMKTGNFLFYSAYSSAYHVNNPTLTTTEVRELLNMTVKNGTKITGKSQGGLFDVILNIETDVVNSTNIDEFTNIYNTLKQIKGYTIWVRGEFIKLLLEHGTNDPDRLNKIKTLLKKETSARVWAEFKEVVLSKIHVVKNEWDYKVRRYTTCVKTEDMQAILDFMEFVKTKPKMNHAPCYNHQTTNRVNRCLRDVPNGKLEWKLEEIMEVKPKIDTEGEKK